MDHPIAPRSGEEEAEILRQLNVALSQASQNAILVRNNSSGKPMKMTGNQRTVWIFLWLVMVVCIDPAINEANLHHQQKYHALAFSGDDVWPEGSVWNPRSR